MAGEKGLDAASGFPISGSGPTYSVQYYREVPHPRYGESRHVSRFPILERKEHFKKKFLPASFLRPSPSPPCQPNNHHPVHPTSTSTTSEDRHKSKSHKAHQVPRRGRPSCPSQSTYTKHHVGTLSTAQQPCRATAQSRDGRGATTSEIQRLGRRYSRGRYGSSGMGFEQNVAGASPARFCARQPWSQWLCLVRFRGWRGRRSPDFVLIVQETVEAPPRTRARFTCASNMRQTHLGASARRARHLLDRIRSQPDRGQSST